MKFYQLLIIEYDDTYKESSDSYYRQTLELYLGGGHMHKIM